jgi:hypothetical protein
VPARRFSGTDAVTGSAFPPALSAAASQDPSGAYDSGKVQAHRQQYFL